MIVIFFIIFGFIYILNFLIPLILYKQNKDNKLFMISNQNLLTKISCLNNYWVIISRNNRYLDISYYLRNDKPLTCDYTPEKEDKYISCGKSGGYNNFDNVCFITLSNLMFLLN